MPNEGNGYSPLPISSEDEDEHLSRPNFSIQRESDDMTVVDSTHKNGQFHPLDETQNVGNRMRNGRSSLGYCNDNIPIMVLDGEGRDLWKRQDMSSVRRICLVLSVLLCILTTLIFLYFLPCDNSTICTETLAPKSSLSWEKTLEGIELQGPISVLPGKPSNLIFLLRRQKFERTDSQPTGLNFPANGGGVLSMKGTTGARLWWTSSKGVPRDINCLVLDNKDSGKVNCVVVDEQGLLESIDYTGLKQWISSVRTCPKLPLLLPDVNSDGFNDLLSVQFGGEPKVKLIIISGGNGKALKTFPISNCETVQLLGLNSNFTIMYSCKSSNSEEKLESIPLDDLLSTVNLSRQKKLGSLANLPFVNEKSVSQRKVIWNLSPIYRLYVENQGKCPGEECQVNVSITVQKKNETRTIWDHFGSGSFASIPTILNKTEEPLKSIGCVLKFWHWSKSNGKEASSGTETVKQILTERVLIVLIKNSDLRVFNASQSEIIQLCKKTDCQPNLELQMKSMAVADLDGDGFSELISYRSSYDAENSHLLTSKVQVVKLDAVLEDHERE